MPTPSEFPHLHLTFQGGYEPLFHGGQKPNPDVAANRANPQLHAQKIRQALGEMRRADDELRRLRAEIGLPAIPADKGFLLKLPEGIDVDQFVHSLGVELVAETEEGLMLVSSIDLQFTRLEEVLRAFELGQEGGGSAASLLGIYGKHDGTERLQSILAPEVFKLWPFEDAKIYTFDIGIQTAASTRDIDWPRVKKKKTETDQEFNTRREEERTKARIAAEEEWLSNAESRATELEPLLRHYNGEIISGIISDQRQEKESGMIFSDSVQVRVRMNGAGFKDVILNFAHLFDVTFPPELQKPDTASQRPITEEQVVVRPPFDNAPTVCIIDSGIQEGHRWLQPAIDSATSRCFLPGTTPDDVADYVQPAGHGTRVAGAVLYPAEVPKSGEVEPVTWIQNARVLDADGSLPESLSPEVYLHDVVACFHSAPRFTKIFNHSINSNVPCPKKRMTSWAAKLDQLSHEHDVLFIQSVGNQTRLGNGDQANPGLAVHLDAGKEPPAHQLEDSMRVANPGQSLHALTVGSVSVDVFEDTNRRSFAKAENQPSGFSRTGYGEPWSVVKPEVVEVGGDLIYSKNAPRLVRQHPDVSIELLNSTMHGAPAFARDGAGTSFAAPKVAHIAAHLQTLFPNASPLLYRALIVQSACWPAWAEREQDKDRVLRLIGYGIPSLERASINSENRVTLITVDAEVIPSKQLHLYTVRIPEELRNAALEAKIRIDVTLAYTAMPRRTRARRTGYLETWLDWESSKLGEPRDEFLTRMQKGNYSFSASEFQGQTSPEGLASAILAKRIQIPDAPTRIESLNRLLRGPSLRPHFSEVTLTGEAVTLAKSTKPLPPSKRIQLNRMILQASFPKECPQWVDYDEFPWIVHKREGWGESDETCRNRGTIQKDWATFDSYNFPEEFAIAVRSHLGWNHLEGAGKARYCLAVSFEVLKGEVPIYSLIRTENEVEVEGQIQGRP